MAPLNSRRATGPSSSLADVPSAHRVRQSPAVVSHTIFHDRCRLVNSWCRLNLRCLQSDETLQFPARLIARNAVDVPDVHGRIRHAAAAQCGNHRSRKRVDIGVADRENVGARGWLRDLIFGDVWIGAEYMAKSDGGDRNCAVAEIVIPSPADVGHPRERAAAFTWPR